MRFHSNLGRLLIVLFFLIATPLLAGDNPRINLDWYGYVKLDASYDQNVTSHGNFAMWVLQKQGDDNDAQFNMTHKQTRFGMKAKGEGYENVKVGGNLEFDLYGSGGTENKAELLLRHAYMTVQTGQFQLLAGQSWDLISPLNPSTLNYPVMWGCGNFGYRRPQVRFTYTTQPSKETSIRFAGGLFRTIGSDLTPTFSLATEVSDGSDDGTDAAIPSVQAIVDVNHKFASGTSLRLGASGLYGELKSEGSLGTDQKYHSRAVVGHAAVNFASGFGFAGEVFNGSNLGSYLGGIANGNTINGVHSQGGWVYGLVKPHAKVKFAAGAGVDDPDDDDLSTGQRSRNQSFFSNVQVTPIPLFTVGFEVSQWETDYKDGEAAKSLRAQTSFLLNF
jgi:hypothetical protein